MAFTTHTLTGNIGSIVDASFDTVTAYLEPSLRGDFIQDPGSGSVLPSRVPVEVAQDGSFSVTVLDSSETGLSYELVAEPRLDGGRLPSVRSDPFTVNAAGRFDEMPFDPPDISEAQRLAALTDAQVAALVPGPSLTGTALDTLLSAHVDDPTGAHAASAVSYDGTVSGLSGNVQAAIDEVAGRVTTSPEAHGAVGDGATSDTAAFTAMFAAIAGAPALVQLMPGKTYYLGSSVAVSGLTNVIIDGAGATILAAADSAFALFDVATTSGLTVRSVRFHGGRVGAYRPLEYGNYGWRLRGSAVNIAFDGCDWSWFNDSCVKAEGENASSPQPDAAVAKNLRITNCRFTDTYHVAMLGKNGTATGFVFANNILTRVNGPVEVDGQASATAYTTHAGNAVIANNVWTDCTGAATVEGALVFIEEDAYDVTVIGNTFRRVTDLAGIHLDDGQTHKSFGRITIANNNFEGFTLSSSGVVTANPYCIIARNQATTSGTALRDVTISGNRFANTAGGAIYVSQAANADSLDNLRIIDNELVDVGCWGTMNAGGNDMIRLAFAGAFTDVKVSGNTFTRRASQLKSSSWLRIDGDRTKTQGVVMVSDNLFESPADADPNVTYLNGLLRLVVSGNLFRKAQCRIDASDGTVVGNTFLAGWAALGVAIATACNVVLLSNSFTKDGSATDYAVKVMQASVITGAGNVMLGYSGNPVFLSSGTYTGTYQRELGATTHGEGTNLVTGATTGTKVGTSTGQKIGFWGSTPVVRPTLSYSRTGESTAEAALRAALAAAGLVTDSTTA